MEVGVVAQAAEITAKGQVEEIDNLPLRGGVK